MTDWRKAGLRVEAPGRGPMASHAMLPTPLLMEDRIRVFFTACDRALRGRVFYADLSRDFPHPVLNIELRPVLDLGPEDAFDRDGVNPSCLVRRADGGLDLYYIGWRRVSDAVPYTLLAGRATSQDEGLSFTKAAAPVLPPTEAEPYFRTAPFVWREADAWRMLYIGGGTFFDGPAGKRLPIYGLRQARSPDGAVWTGDEEPLLEPDRQAGEIGFGRPVLWRDRTGGPMLMLSRRTTTGYRLVEARWARAGVDPTGFHDVVAPGPEAWDAEMTCFGAPILCDGRELLFYNGNQFGRSGFGLAWRAATA